MENYYALLVCWTEFMDSVKDYNNGNCGCTVLYRISAETVTDGIDLTKRWLLFHRPQTSSSVTAVYRVYAPEYLQPSLNPNHSWQEPEYRSKSLAFCSLKAQRFNNPLNMALSPRVLSVLVLANSLGSVLSCGGGPKPCSWTTCRLEWRNDWSPSVPSGRCVNQRRNGHHITSKHNGKGSCPSPSPCSPRTQSRTLCKFGLINLGKSLETLLWNPFLLLLRFNEKITTKIFSSLNLE